MSLRGVYYLPFNLDDPVDTYISTLKYIFISKKIVRIQRVFDHLPSVSLFSVLCVLKCLCLPILSSLYEPTMRCGNVHD